MTLRVLIADDARDVAEVVAFGARMNWPDCAVTLADDGEEALRRFQEERPDLVILDVSMPPPDGYEVCRRIRSLSSVPILMLTVHDETLDKVRALDLGADDYLTKPFDHIELLARMRALVRRSASGAGRGPAESALSPATGRFVADGFDLDFATREVCVSGRRVLLTSTEYRLLEALVRGAGTAVSHRALLERAWGPEYGGDTQYLKVFIGRLRRKLGDDPEHPHFIQTEWGIGYRFVAPP